LVWVEPAPFLGVPRPLTSCPEVNAMATVEHGELHVVVPVGFLLSETREVTVSVDRPGGAPLPVRLRLIPARAVETTGTAALVPVQDESAPRRDTCAWPRRAALDEDIYGEPEYGGGD
jgi:hypothetical protein